MVDLDPEYVAARGVLLDALEALADHREAIVLVGAQAVYLQTVPLPGYQPYTTDADLAINPSLLGPRPGLEEAMRRAGFRLKDEDTGHPEPGIWEARIRVAQRRDDLVVPVDLIVPEAVAPPGGRRGARLAGEHGRRAARRATGLEGALVDHSLIEVGALDEGDSRRTTVNVAGLAALLVAKLHKIGDRADRPDRLTDKDAGDVLRLFMSATSQDMTQRLIDLLEDARSAGATRAAIDRLDPLFGTPRSLGTQMAVRALAGVLDPATVQATCRTFAAQVLAALGGAG
ncbi:MAG: hypothetical protein GWP04_12190 [Gammaproteobacteria bacterium]|nr:hypothetical protein [Gammaproteobacteria bacterium]